MTITEYGTDDLSRNAEWGTQTDALDPEYAVAGGQVYFKTGSTEQWSMSRGFYNAPGDYMTSPFNSRWEAKELTTPELFFSLVSCGDSLYGAAANGRRPHNRGIHGGPGNRPTSGDLHHGV